MNKPDKSDEFFKAKIKNIVSIAENQNYPKFSSFLDPRQQHMADEVLRQCGCFNYRYFGGQDGSERVMLGVCPDYMDPEELCFPFTILEFRYSKNYALSHRDFLGALMAAQIKREMLGDIIVSEGITDIFVQEDLADYIIGNIQKVGNVGVTIERRETASLVREQRFEEISGTVASLRLDCVLALITKLSRTKVLELLEAGRVSLNYQQTVSASGTVKPQDIITVKGYGKHILSDEIHLTKKERYHITIYKFAT